MFAFAPIFVRGAGGDADPVAITTIRTVSAFLILVPFWLWSRIADYRSASASASKLTPSSGDGLLLPAARIFTRAEVGWSALAGFFLSAHFMLWIGSLFYTSVASASVLVTIHPIMLIIVESLWLKKKFPIASWMGVLVAFGGSVVLGITDSAPNEQYANPILGNIMALSAAFLFVFYILISQKIRKNSGWLDYVFAVYGFTALGSVMIAFVLGVSWWHQPMPTVWSGLALAVGASIIGHGSMNYAVKFVSATLLSTLILSEPVFATILAYFIFEEMPSIGSIIAMIIIMAGVLVTWWARRKAIVKDGGL
ncbi:MAG: DMT family transporter [Bacteroidetes bacterium]|nr:DMT family transporter [Bacteroidota bacterium]